MNRLAQQTSPYLLQHAHNPVDWYPWGEEALARARREDKPILVSIGYSTCHWCHVMERESFEVEAVAKIMNEHFVCIKVDREERPDVDRVYMEACTAISGGGGWPLNAFLLPDARPFFAGTYYPPERKYNRPSWTEVLLHLSGLYRDDRDQLIEQAEGLVKNIAGAGSRMLGLESKNEDSVAALRARYDQGRGGFGGAPKFPMSQSLELLLNSGIVNGRPGDIHLARHGMLAMLDGGIYDQLGGGFSRYTVDAAWRVPHFEKMLYDNALLLRLLGKLHCTTPDARFATAINETTDWLLREMALATGGYRAALDADSEGVEGKYYTWTYGEIAALLEGEDLELFTTFYGVTEAGNWEEERTNIFYRPDSLAAAAAKVGLPIDVAEAKLAAARKRLHELQVTRIPPGADDKLLLQWNALLVSGWCWCYRATGDARLLTLARDTWETLRRELNESGQWYRNKTSGQLGADAFLDDYAALIEAGLDLLEIDQNLDRVGELSELADLVLDTFSADNGLFNLRPPEESELPVTTQDLFDNALPSGNSQMVHNLLRLARLTGSTTYQEHADRMLKAMRGAVERYPTSFANWAAAAMINGGDSRELVITGPGARAAAAAFLSDYRPGLLIVATETPREDVPLLSGRYGEELRFFVCKNRSCQLPVTTASKAAKFLST